jgi:citrate synthase
MVPRPSTFTRQTGYTTLDQGFVNTSATKSAITYIDGDKGILRYRGYAIEDVAANSTYLEVAWLLIYGQLPSASELEAFEDRVRRHTLLHEDLRRFFDALPHNAHPMSVLSSAVSALSTFYEDSLSVHDPEQVELSTIRLLAKLPIIAAYAHKKALGQAFLYPDNSLSFTDNFLKLNFGNMAEPYVVNPVVSRALERLLILHEDHEQNASTSTVRLVGSTEANMFASISAGINALYGPLHGGANEAVLKMLGEIKESGESVEKFVERVKNKEDGIRLMGFGHRVYKNFDPRARLVKESADEVLAALGVKDDLLDIAKELEAVALADDYFIERKLYPNVDFYTGVIYKAMGFPPRMFTVLFAIGRLPGWIAHWREMNNDPSTKIGRPQQLYVGEPRRDWPAR